MSKVSLIYTQWFVFYKQIYAIPFMVHRVGAYFIRDGKNWTETKMVHGGWWLK